MRLFLLFVVLGASVAAFAADDPILAVPQLEQPVAKPAADDPLQAKYDAAWTRYREAIAKITAEVTKALDAQFEKAADAGSLELADMWDKKKKSFLDTHTVEWPSDGKAKADWRKSNPEVDFPKDFTEVVASAQQAYAAAVNALKGDYEALVKEYTKARNLERAKQLKEEMASLDRPPVVPPSRPRVVEDGPAEAKGESSISLTKGRLEDHWQLVDPGKERNWDLGDGVLICRNDGTSLISKQRFSDFDLRLDFRLPPRCNSGIYLRGCYEIQLLDSMWRTPDNQPAKPDQGTGAIYNQITPRKDAYRGPNVWNTLAVRLQGNVVTIHLNGENIVDARAIEKPSVGGVCGDPKLGPLMIQSHSQMSGAQFRNIVITPLEKR